MNGGSRKNYNGEGLKRSLPSGKGAKDLAAAHSYLVAMITRLIRDYRKPIAWERNLRQASGGSLPEERAEAASRTPAKNPNMPRHKKRKGAEPEKEP